VQLDQPAAAVIALYGALNEIVAALGVRMFWRPAPKRTSSRPPSWVQAGHRHAYAPNIERSSACIPTLSSSWPARRESEEALAALERLGLKTALFRTSSFPSCFPLSGGWASGRAEDAATALVTSTEKRLDEVARAVADEPRPGVVFEGATRTCWRGGRFQWSLT
jgi:iron complex transport system substrate-binding protein